MDSSRTTCAFPGEQTEPIFAASVSDTSFLIAEEALSLNESGISLRSCYREQYPLGLSRPLMLDA